MIRNQQRAAARARGGSVARDINIPLPVKGTMVEANTAEVSGVYAGELLNWRSTGASLELRSQHSLDLTGRTALQRIAFEFGPSQDYIEVHSNRVSVGAASIRRQFSKTMDTAHISANAVMADGNGNPLRYNGTAFSEAVFTTTTATSPDEFDGVIAHQDRLFFWKTGDALDYYYGDVGAIQGGLSRFPLGRLGNITGSILCLKSMTVDAGHGMNDTLAIFSSTGDIIAYEGLDPGDPQDWRQLTRLKVAPPVSPKAFVAVGADQWMLTASGVVSVSQTLRDSSLALVNTVSRPIQKKIVAQVAEGGDWSMHLSADATMVIINRVYQGTAKQFIYRTDTRTWDETDFPAKAWHNLGRKTQFTTLDGELATLGASDEQITATWVSSWFRLPRSSGITYLVPTIIANGSLEVKVVLLSDHDETGVDISESEQTVTIEPDDPADPGGRVSLNETIGVDAVGEVFQLRMEVTARWAEIVNLKAGVQ